jgi:hypothetical protein
MDKCGYIYRLFLTGGVLGFRCGLKSVIYTNKSWYFLMPDIDDISDELLLKYGVFDEPSVSSFK